MENKIHIVPDKTKFSVLDAKHAFEQLSNKDKLYAYHMYKASWAGMTIVPRQISNESIYLFEMFINMFTEINVSQLISENKDDQNLIKFLNYVAMVLSNGGNYLSMGDSKFIPNLQESEMRQLYNKYFVKYITDYLYIKDKIFSLKDNEKFLGYPPNNTTTYFSLNMSKDDAKIVDDYIVEKGYEGWNTMCEKHIIDNHPHYYILIASVRTDDEIIDEYKDYTIHVRNGNFSSNMMGIVFHLQNALLYANDTQKNMLKEYIKHFISGNLNDHKESQKYWIQDICPTVETNMGFIENYRDPSNMRSEFESFVAMIDKEKTEKLKNLVNNAEYFLDKLPWTKEFEKDKFHPPDFTSLEILCFVTSGIPAGINIPNYDDIRQTIGFKNVSLGNVLGANLVGTEPPRYLSKTDGELYQKYVKDAFDVDVSGHELLGHGSGKLFIENDKHEFNFDRNIINPLTGQKISSWYKNNETWGSKFGKLSSTYEECRAECVGLYLSNFKEMHDIFGHKDWKTVRYVNWILMILSGICGLITYDEKGKQWLQAHNQARFAIYNVCRRSGVVKVKMNNNDKMFELEFDEEKMKTDGMKALGDFLNKLNIYKACADVENGVKLFDEYTSVDDYHLNIKNILIENMKPRAQFVQPTLTRNDNNVIEYNNYDPTVDGLIQSYVDKFNA